MNRLGAFALGHHSGQVSRVWLPTKDAIDADGQLLFKPRASLVDAEASLPDLNAVMLLRIGARPDSGAGSGVIAP